MNSGITLIATDIDGVLTDGPAILDVNGNEQKIISYKDLDAHSLGKRMGIDFVFITGEDNRMVKIICERFGADRVQAGAKNKLPVLISVCEKLGLKNSQVCYIGDSDRDVEAIKWAGLGIAPRDASKRAILAANYVTECKGGDGVLAEVLEFLFRNIREGENIED